MKTALLRLAAAVALVAAFAGAAYRLSTISPDAAGVSPCAADAAGSVDALEQCLAVQPGNVEAMVGLGTSYEAAGRLDRAEAMYRRALSSDAKDSVARLKLSRLLLRSGDQRRARAEGERLLALRPGSTEAAALAAGVESDEAR